MKIQLALERLGYPHNQIVTYLALLKMGEGTVTEIAHKSQLPRSTTQLVVSTLKNKGLASTFKRRGQQIWVAENPARFLEEIQDKTLLVKRLIPELQSLRNGLKDKPLFKEVSGASGIRLLFDELLESNYPIRILGSMTNIMDHLGEDVTTVFLERLFKRTASTRLLTNRSDFTEQLKERQFNSKNQVRLYDNDQRHYVLHILCNTEISTILFNGNDTTGIVINDNELAESWACFFEKLWVDSK